jgi:hypothetical protein
MPVIQTPSVVENVAGSAIGLEGALDFVAPIAGDKPLLNPAHP